MWETGWPRQGAGARPGLGGGGLGEGRCLLWGARWLLLSISVLDCLSRSLLRLQYGGQAGGWWSSWLFGPLDSGYLLCLVDLVGVVVDWNSPVRVAKFRQK